MSNKLYAGNLNFNITEDELADVFAEFGNVVDVHIVFDRYTNRSKGFGFVEMETAEEAQAAIAGLEGKEVMNREIRVSEAKPRAPRPQY